MAISIEAVETFPHNVEKCMTTPVENVDKEKDEMLLSIVADAVVDPRAMMIHSGNAVLTY